MAEKTWQKIKQNPELLDQYRWRGLVIDGIRLFFKRQQFIEVETPLLVESPGTEPYLEVFETKLEIADGRSKAGYLLTSPEYAMKKLLAAGMSKIFTVCKSFRNGEGIGPMHNHEFTILEWYRASADYTDIMTDCENLVRFLAENLHGNADQIEYQGKMLNLSAPWPRRSVAELFYEYVGITADELVSDRLPAIAQSYGYNADTWDDAFHLLFMNMIEPMLAVKDQPIFVYDYPVQQAALAKKKADDPRFAERFELYLNGVELANAFSELTDAQEQRARLESELVQRQSLGKTKYQLDEDFIAALESGMPPSGGVALGVDRLIMFFAGVPSIKDTLLFPIEELFNLE